MQMIYYILANEPLVPLLSGWSHFKMASFKERLASVVEGFPVLYNKTLRDFNDKAKKKNAWNKGIPGG